MDTGKERGLKPVEALRNRGVAVSMAAAALNASIQQGA